MEKNKIEKYKERLLKEGDTLKRELESVGKKNPNSPSDWDAVTPEEEIETADRNDVADEIEDYENNNAIIDQLESRMFEVQRALEKIEEGTYGKCEISGELIEEDRLDANPAARTCKKHIDEKI
ncbi:MAG: TraR/DksA C4-type zinc finger protein [bacterium]